VKAADARDAPPRRSLLGLLIPSFIVFAILIGLGVWQLQRKAWKENLIASLDAQLAAAPVPLPARVTWPRLDPAANEYRRVTFRAAFDHAHEALVYAAPSAFRPDASGPGFWVLTPARLPDGGILFVNRGFVPDSRRDPATRADGQVSAPVDVTGVLRWPDTRHWFTPADEPSHNLWFSRDPVATAAAKGLGPVAPFYVEQEAPVPPGGLPQPGKIVVALPDNHLQYAVTWFGLAIVLAVMSTVWTLRNVRPKPSGVS
jgi:surfeit locus 1 family protein